MAKDIFIYGTIGFDWWTGEDNSAKNLIDQLAAVPENEEVNIRINSPGGDVVEGVAMYNAIATHKGKTVTINDGMAASMAFILLQAGDTRKAYKNSTGLVHNASGIAWGNAKDLKATAELLDKIDISLIESIAQKSGITAEEVKTKWFDYSDHSLSAQDMLDGGLVDEVVDLSAKGVPANTAAMSRKELFAAYAKIEKPNEEKGFLAKINKMIQDAFKSNKPKDSTNTDEDMKIPISAEHTAVAAILGLTFAEGETSKEVELTDEHITAIQAKLNELDTTATAAISAKGAAEDSLVTARAEIETLKAAAKAAPGAKSTNPAIKDENHNKAKSSEAVADDDPIQAYAKKMLESY